ncbi:MAG TPA: NlpC/P60 family protein, partial [Solirubrobacterales bacterium]|nr:NlpC/P60 family protein [Solirubrobacterales bacterium]
MAKRGRIRLYFEGEERGVDEAAGKSVRAINRVDAATERYNKTAAAQATAVDRVNDRNFKLSSSTRRVRDDNVSLAKQLQAVNVRFTSMRNIVSVIKWPALIAGTGYAAQGLGQMGAAAVALTGALAPLTGALVAYPALLGAFAQALGVGQLALMGIGDALGEMSQQQAAAGETAKESAKAQEAAAEQVSQAERQVQDAQRNSEQAQRALTEARKEAREELEDLKNAAIQAAFGEERAVLSLREARRELQAARKDPGSVSPDEMTGLELQVEEAKQALKEARQDRKDTDRERSASQRRGVDKSPAVVQARQQREEARRQVADARRELKKAQEAEEEALEGLRATASAAATALDKLPPSAQRFAHFLFGLKPKVDELRETAADGLLPGVERGIKSALPLFPRLRAAIGGTTGVLSRANEKAGEFIGSKGFGRDFSRITEGNATLIGRMASSGMNLFSALRHIMVAAQPFLGWLGKSTVRLTGWVEGITEAGRRSGRLGDFFDKTRSTMARVASTLQSVSAGFLQVGKAAAPLGRDILDSLDESAQRFEDWAESLEGRNSLKAYFAEARPGVFEMGRLVRDVVKSFVRLSGGEGFVTLTRALRTDLLPVLEEVVEKTTRSFGPHLVGLLVQVARLFGHLAGSSGPLTKFVDGVSKVLGFINLLIEKVPGLGGVLVTLSGFVAVNKALKFTAAITGVSKLVDWFGKLQKAATGAAIAEQAAASGPGGGGFLGKLRGKGSGLLGKLGLGRAATTVAPAGMLGGAEVASVLGSGGGGLLAAAPAAGPWLAAAAAIAAAGAGVYLLYRHSETFRKLVAPLGDAASDAFGEIKTQVSLLGEAFTGPDSPVGAAKSFYSQFKAPIDAVGRVVKSVFLFQVKNAFGTIAETMRGLGQVFSGEIQVIRGVVEVISGILTLKFGKAWDGVQNIFGGGVKMVIGVMRTLAAPVTTVVKNVAGAIGDLFGGAWDRIKDAFRTGRDAVVGFVEDIADVINLIPGIPDIEIGEKSFAERAGNINSVPGASSGGLGKPKAQNRYTGGPVTRPMVIVGEEAPQHPEWVIATNPQYRQNNIAYWMQAGRDLGVPGFLTGGDIWGAAKSVGGAIGGLAGKGAGFFVDKLPTPQLPAWMGELGGYVIDHVSDWIKSGFSSGKMGSKGPANLPVAAKAWNGKVLMGRVSYFNGPATTTASGVPVARPGLALNLHPGTDAGWDNDTTRAWMAAAAGGHPVYGRTTIAGHTANLPIIDLGPSGFTGRAIDVTEGGVKKLGLDPASFPTDSIGKVRILARRRGGAISGPLRDWSGTSTIGGGPGLAMLRGSAKGTAGRAADWARNNLGVGEGSAKHRKWVGETEGVFDPWCAEFVGAMLIAQGVPLPANSAYTPEYEHGWSGGKNIGSSISLARPGDLLGYSGEHIGVYVGGGKFISGNWSNEVGIADWNAPSYPLTAVMRPAYPGGAGTKGGRGGKGAGGR